RRLHYSAAVTIRRSRPAVALSGIICSMNLSCVVTMLALIAVAAIQPVTAQVHGAGATFPAPVYAAWASAYQQLAGVQVSSEAVVSGEGIERIRRQQVDFGATDAPLSAEELDRAGLIQFPVVIGGVVPVINITGIKPGQLRLSGALLADIYRG